MKDKTNYEKDTRSAYRNTLRAQAYKDQYTRQITWARLTMWRGQQILLQALKYCNLSASDTILDFPCGTGVSAHTLRQFPCAIVACDISHAMMTLAREDYWQNNFQGFVQADIADPPFNQHTFACIVMLGFMHRVPADVRDLALTNMYSLSKKYLIVSYAIDSPLQRVKLGFMKLLRPAHQPAPCPTRLQGILEEFRSHGFIVRKMFPIIYFLCSHRIFLLEKQER